MVGRVLPTAMCVRGVDDLCVLQFTLIIAAGCALHRRTSRVIHRIELYFLVSREGGGNFPPALTPIPQRRTASVVDGKANYKHCHHMETNRARATELVSSSAAAQTVGTSNPARMTTYNVALTPRGGPLTLPLKGRVSDPRQDARLRIAPNLPPRTIAMS